MALVTVNAFAMGGSSTNVSKILDQVPTASESQKGLVRIGQGLKMTGDILNSDVSIFAGGASGLVPPSNSNDNEKFLRGDGAWAVPTFTLGSTSSTVNGAFWLEDE